MATRKNSLNSHICPICGCFFAQNTPKTAKMCIFPHLYTSAICMYLPDLYFCFAALYHIGTHSIGARTDPHRKQAANCGLFFFCVLRLPAQCTIGMEREPQRLQMACAAALYHNSRTDPQRASADATGTMYHRHGATASAGTDGMCCGSIP